MSLALAPYNFSLTDQSPLLQYRPFRDGPLETSWNVSYSANTHLAWEPGNYPDAFVSSYTTQLVGASVELEWTGTAIWFYGVADPAAYDVQLDGSSAIAGAGTNSSDGTLFSLTDLEYGLHSATLTVVKAPVTVLGATITVGLGETGSILETRNISAVTNNIPPTANPMFSSNGDYWTVNSSYAYDNTTESYPRVVTDMQSASLTFLLNSTVGFAILGSCDYDHGAYNVTLDPPPPDGFVGSTQYNASSHWIALNEIKYLATGMDRTQNYTVTVTNMQKAVFDLAQVMLFDAVPPSPTPTPSVLHSGFMTVPAPSSILATTFTTSSSAKPSKLPTQSRPSGAGTMVGIAVGAVLAACAVIVAVFFLIRRRERRRGTRPIDLLQSRISDFALSPRQLTSPTAQSDRHLAPDYSPDPFLKAYMMPPLPVHRATGLLRSPNIAQFRQRAASTPTLFGRSPGSHERDAGHMTLTRPPLYDPAWMESSSTLHPHDRV